MQVLKTKTTVYKTSAKPPKIKDCPYCKSELTFTEKDFFPCSCTFQACANCYDDILHNKGLCPTCHKPLRASRVKALQVSKKEELHKSEMETLNKDKVAKKCTTITVVTTVSSKHPHISSHPQTVKSDPRANLPKMSFSELSKLRIVQRNLVYVIGLAPQIAKPEILEKPEYFGQYGKINKIVVNKGNAYNSASPSGPSFSAYITFAKELDASVAIFAADQYVLYDRTLRTSYGTTKYCTFLLKGQSCPNPDCLYLHTAENREELLIKDEMITNKEIFVDQQKLTIDFIEKHYDEVMRKQNPESKTKAVLPSISIVQSKVKRLIDQQVKERKERELLAKEKIKLRSTNIENNKENRNINGNSLRNSAKKSVEMDTRSSNHDIESATESLSPSKASARQDSKMEDNSEAALHSHRSSSSNWSTTDCSTKKDLNSDHNHKEESEMKTGSHSPVERKGSENEEAPSVSEVNDKQASEELKTKNIFMELMEANSLIITNDNGQKEFEDPYKDNFDKAIFERITDDIHNAQASRFQCTQGCEDEESEYDDSKLVEINSKDAEYEEFSEISKSITEFIESQEESSASQNNSNIENKANPSRNSQDIKNAGLSVNGNGKQDDSAGKSKPEDSPIYLPQNGAMKTTANKVKQIIQKGLNNSNNCIKHVQEDEIGLKQPVNKSAEYNSINKNIDIPNYTNNANIHTRNHYNNKINGYKLSSFK